MWGMGSKCIAKEDLVGHCVFKHGITGGVALHETFPSCKILSEKHFFNVEECFVVSISFKPLMTKHLHKLDNPGAKHPHFVYVYLDCHVLTTLCMCTK